MKKSEEFQNSSLFFISKGNALSAAPFFALQKLRR